MRSTILILLLAASAACGGAAGADPAGGQTEGDGGGAGAPQGGGVDPDGESVSFERLDAAGDCAGLVPERAPAPVAVEARASGGAACVGGTSDGTGAVAIGARDASGATTWQAYASDGTARSRFAADPPLLSEPAGWHAVAASGPQGAFDTKVEVVAFGPDGSALRREVASPDPSQAAYPRWNLARDPAGGSFLALRSSLLAGNHWSTVAAARFAASGAPSWPGGSVRIRIVPAPTEPLFLAGGASARGELLVLSQSAASLDVTWIQPSSGAPIPGASAERAEAAAGVVGAGLAPQLELHPLLDGSLAVRSDGTYRRAYLPLATASSPLPAWLADRAASTLRITRGNAGYALFPPAGQPSADCAQRIDLVSRSGRLCGRVVLRQRAASCTTGVVDQGWDGTVVQQSAQDACTFRWWPRLLGK
jgi:hypothetical protein